MKEESASQLVRNTIRPRRQQTKLQELKQHDRTKRRSGEDILSCAKNEPMGNIALAYPALCNGESLLLLVNAGLTRSRKNECDTSPPSLELSTPSICPINKWGLSVPPAPGTFLEVGLETIAIGRELRAIGSG